MSSHHIGNFAMWRIAAWARDSGRSHVYLGTAYREAALYKVRNFKPACVEFWDGARWRADVKLLKELCRADDAAQQADASKADRFKQLEDSGADGAGERAQAKFVEDLLLLGDE